MVIHTFLKSELHGFVDAMKGTGFSWGRLLVLIACSCGPWVKKPSVSGIDIIDAFVSLLFIERETQTSTQLCSVQS